MSASYADVGEGEARNLLGALVCMHRPHVIGGYVLAAAVAGWLRCSTGIGAGAFRYRGGGGAAAAAGADAACTAGRR